LKHHLKTPNAAPLTVGPDKRKLVIDDQFEVPDRKDDVKDKDVDKVIVYTFFVQSIPIVEKVSFCSPLPPPFHHCCDVSILDAHRPSGHFFHSSYPPCLRVRPGRTYCTPKVFFNGVLLPHLCVRPGRTHRACILFCYCLWSQPITNQYILLSASSLLALSRSYCTAICPCARVQQRSIASTVIPRHG
jgi:hypothetical protein